MSCRDYVVVNSFAEEPFGGNPAAVFPDAAGLPEPRLQDIARQLNLVETVFVYPAIETDVDFELRYFTPDEELPIAGHPTVAAWIALSELRVLDQKRTVFRQRTKPGVQEILVQRNGRVVVGMRQIEPRFAGDISDRRRVAEVFSIDENDFAADLPISAVDIGLGHIIACVKDLSSLMKVRRNSPALLRLCSEFGVREAQLFCLQTLHGSNDLHTRNICPREGLEDPACGNGCAALGAYLSRTPLFPAEEFTFRAEQGHIIGMPSVIEVQVKRRESAAPAITISGGGIVMLAGSLLCDL